MGITKRSCPTNCSCLLSFFVDGVRWWCSFMVSCWWRWSMLIKERDIIMMRLNIAIFTSILYTTLVSVLCIVACFVIQPPAPNALSVLCCRIWLLGVDTCELARMPAEYNLWDNWCIHHSVACGCVGNSKAIDMRETKTLVYSLRFTVLIAACSARLNNKDSSNDWSYVNRWFCVSSLLLEPARDQVVTTLTYSFDRVGRIRLIIHLLPFALPTLLLYTIHYRSTPSTTRIRLVQLIINLNDHVRLVGSSLDYCHLRLAHNKNVYAHLDRWLAIRIQPHTLRVTSSSTLIFLEQDLVYPLYSTGSLASRINQLPSLVHWLAFSCYSIWDTTQAVHQQTWSLPFQQHDLVS